MTKIQKVRTACFMFAMLALTFVFAFGVSLNPESASGEAPQRGSLKPVPSGGFKSAAILEKMSKTLDSIDARLKRLEEHAETIAKNTREAP